MSEELPPDTTPNSTSITYFSIVRIRHHSGKLLASTNQKYSHARGSKQQIVGCIEDATASTLWLLRPGNRCDHEKSGSENIEEGDVIRLQHLETGRNLHSSNHISPNSNQQEVSCFGDDGFGNFDDDWVIQSHDGKGLEKNKTLRLRHVRTDNYLHSHDDRSFEIDDQEFQEVACYNYNDSNNEWQIIQVLPAPAKFTLHPFLSFSSNNVQKSFNRLVDVQKWLKDEIQKFSWVRELPTPPAHSSLRRHLSIGFETLNNRIQQCNINTEPRSFQKACELADTEFINSYKNGSLLFSDSSTYHFINSIKEDDPLAASHALAYFLHLDPELTSGGFKGFFSALCHEFALADRAKSEAKTLEIIKESFIDALENEKAKQERLTKTLESHLAIAQIALQEKERAFTDLTKKSEDELKAVTATYDNHMATHASVSYWSTKARKHEKIYKKLATMATLSGSIVVLALILLVLDVFGFSNQASGEAPQWWRIGIGIVVATFGIWGVRVMVQLLYSNVHQMSDADERATMIQAYQAMMREQVLPLKEEHKLLILQSLFRTASSSAVKDDGSPTTWLDLIANKISVK